MDVISQTHLAVLIGVSGHPGFGLGVLASGARWISDGKFMSASCALGKYPRTVDCDALPLLPSLYEIRGVSRFIARAVVTQAQAGRPGAGNDRGSTGGEDRSNIQMAGICSARLSCCKHGCINL